MSIAPVDIPVKVKGLSDLQKLERRMEALEKEITRLQRASQKTSKALPAVGGGAKKAAVGVRALGASFQAALGPLAPLLAGIAGLQSAFQTLSQQDFGEAKVRSLGVDSEALVSQLKVVSNELQGQASVAELTGAAYDVASAGFTNAADAAAILKAASLGATGGFSDINTVADAATSVLNAYGASAKDAGLLVDGFIQTQNDGKIVVDDYARNIGKVASAAAGLKVPITEVNAVIAQATASGVQGEVAFTGLKGALARLASGEATKALKGTGIEINAATVEADGLLGTLKKLQGLDTGQIFKALGTEAGPALLPVIQNLEKFEELIRKQEEAAGASAKAQAQAADTIQGAWNRLTVAFQNLFSDQSELGDAIKVALLAAAATVEALAAAFNLLMSVSRGVGDGILAVIQSLTGLESGSEVLQMLTDQWFQLLQGVNTVANGISQTISRFIQFAAQGLGQLFGWIGEQVTKIGGWFSGLWNGVSEGVAGVGTNIFNVFKGAFQAVANLITGFYNGLPDWMKKALTGAATGIGNFFSGVLEGVANELEYVVKLARETSPGSGSAGKSGGGVSTPLLGGGGASKELSDQEKILETQQKQIDKMAEYVDKQAQAATKAADRLRTENEFLQLEIDKGKEFADTARQINRLVLEGVPFTEAFELVTANQNLKKTLEATKEVKEETSDLDKLWESIGQRVVGGIEEGITGLIDGTKDLQEVLSDVLKDLGKMLLQFGLKAGAAGLGIPGFAEGGFVSGPTPALVGEGGESEYIIPSSKMEGAMARYNAGARGSAVIPGEGGGSSGGMGGGGNTTVNYNGPTLRFNSDDYVPVSAVSGIIDEAVNRGSKAGEARTLASLKNSRAKRSRIGI